MPRNYWFASSVLSLLLVFLILLLLRYIRVPTLTPCEPDIPVSAGLLTSPPADIADVAGVIPLGNLNPGGEHVLSVDHMYLTYPSPAGGGSMTFPVNNMADGELFMLFRQQVDGRPDFYYQLFIQHTCSVHSYFDHLHELSSAIDTYITNHSISWLDLGGSGGAATLTLAAGDQMGVTKNYSHAWDVGIVDTRQVNGSFANPSSNRYPTYSDYVPLFPVLSGIDLSIYSFGNKMLNDACFIDYMDNSAGMQAAWRA